MLSKEQKIEYYSKALKNIRRSRKFREITVKGICVELHMAYAEDHPESDSFMVFQNSKLRLLFPELCKKMPKGEVLGAYWWGFDKEGNDEREKALTEIIQNLKA